MHYLKRRLTTKTIMLILFSLFRFSNHQKGHNEKKLILVSKITTSLNFISEVFSCYVKILEAYITIMQLNSNM